jgi:hypothetical protein
MIHVGNSARSSSLPLLVLAAAVALLVTASAAFGEELTREEYVARVEPICKKNSDENSRILKGVKAQVKRGALAPAGKRFVKASGVFGQTVRQIAEVPKPIADEAKLTTWIGYLKLEGTYLRKVGKALEAGSKFKAQRYAVKLNEDNKRANNTVISFGFDHCRIESSRYL